jgi:hypothetical protein
MCTIECGFSFSVNNFRSDSAGSAKAAKIEPEPSVEINVGLSKLFDLARVLVRVASFVVSTQDSHLARQQKKSKKIKFVDGSHLEMVERFNAFLSRVA